VIGLGHRERIAAGNLHWVKGPFGKCASRRGQIAEAAQGSRNSAAAHARGIRMDTFDFEAEAELFPTRSRASRRKPMAYKRFSRAADAIRYAIEELPAEFLVGAFLEVNEERFDSAEMRRLYERPDYPLERVRPTAPALAPAAGRVDWKRS
jgi:hypothetical protein